MTSIQLLEIEELAKQFDEFNNMQMIVDNQIDDSKSYDFGELVVSAQTLGFKIHIPDNIVMNLFYSDQTRIMITVDCDDKRAYINTTKLWDFINRQKQIMLVH